MRETVMGRYRAIFKGGKLVAEVADGVTVFADAEYYDKSKRSELAAPMIMKDIGEYVSPIDGAAITSRSAHREHMRTHDVIEVGNERMAQQTDTRNVREIGEVVKRHVEQVEAMPQAAYDEHVAIQQHEHAEVAKLATAG